MSSILLALLATTCLASPLRERQIANNDVPGTPVGPVGAAGAIYPTTSLEGPALSVAITESSYGAAATLSPGSYQLATN